MTIQLSQVIVEQAPHSSSSALLFQNKKKEAKGNEMTLAVVPAVIHVDETLSGKEKKTDI